MKGVAAALTDPLRFGRWVGDPAPWRAWSAILKGAFLEPMTDDEVATFRRLTDRDPPTVPIRELWVIAGRRGGKSVTAAEIATYAAAYIDWQPYLKPGEVATIPVLAQDRSAARTIFRYVGALLKAAGKDYLIESETNEALELSNSVNIEITTSSARAARGYSMPLIVCDEIAHWRAAETTEPDVEVLEALRPAQVQFPNPLIVAISSPHARRGALWEAYDQHYGKDGDVLVVRGSTRDFNATVPQSEVDRALARDPGRARAEFLGLFRDDIESFLSLEAVDAVTVPGRFELPYVQRHRYVAFCDLSGGRSDSATLAIAHGEDGIAILDLVREVPAPHTPEDVVREFAETLRSFNLKTVTGDRYAAEWSKDSFRRNGIFLKPSERTRSELYIELLPAVNSGQVRLLQHEKLKLQLTTLERQVTRGGRESVDHGRGGSDDVANSVAGALVLAASTKREPWQAIPGIAIGGPRRASLNDPHGRGDYLPGIGH